MTRPVLHTQFTPRWNPELEGYTINTLRRSWPSISSTYEFEDLLQEAYLVFMRCARVFRGYGDNPPALFMGFYKKTLANKLTDLSIRHSRYSCCVMDINIEQATLDNADPSMVQELVELLHTLPSELTEVLSLLTNSVPQRRGLYTTKAARKLKALLRAA